MCRWLVYHGFSDACTFGSEVVEWGESCKGWIRETAEEANFFASDIILDRKMCSETHSDIGPVEGTGVGRCCGCGGGLLQGKILPSSDTCTDRDSTQGGCMRRGRVQLLRPSTPT
jgi:hypothetical protein